MVARFQSVCRCGCGTPVQPGDAITRTEDKGWVLTEHAAIPRPGREETFLHGLKPVARRGRNPWVTDAMNGEVAAAFGERGVYFTEYQYADEMGPDTCPDGHEAWYKPTVGAYVCQCGRIRTGKGWTEPR